VYTQQNPVNKEAKMIAPANKSVFQVFSVHLDSSVIKFSSPL